MAHPETKHFVPGEDLSEKSHLVQQIKELPRELRTTETVRFTEKENNHDVEMVGTYSTFPEVNWAVIAQRSVKEARADAGVTELNRQALAFVSVVVLIAVLFGYFFAVGISGPIRSLAASTRAISRGEFHQRTPVRGAAEISELAENFNLMASDIEEYIERLKEAAEENRELFIGSIRMLAAAIDEKDPYTRGHSGRVAKYSTVIAQELKLTPEDLDKLKISALLHDVGKIGVDDRVLKKPGVANAGRIRNHEDAYDQGREYHASGVAVERHAARHRVAPRASGWAWLSLRFVWAADPVDGADYRGGGYVGRDDHEPAVPVGDGFGIRAGPHQGADRIEVRSVGGECAGIRGESG